MYVFTGGPVYILPVVFFVSRVCLVNPFGLDIRCLPLLKELFTFTSIIFFFFFVFISGKESDFR